MRWLPVGVMGQLRAENVTETGGEDILWFWTGDRMEMRGSWKGDR